MKNKFKKERIVLIFILAGLYLFFFTSKITMNAQSDLQYTAYNTPITISTNKSVKIIKWTYSPNQNIMEIELSYSNQTFDGNDDLTFAAYTRQSTLSSGTATAVDTIIDEPTYKVIHVTVPDKFKEVSLQISDGNSSAKIYSNINEVEQISSITILSPAEYKNRLIGYDIIKYQDEYTQLQSDIDKNNITITNIDSTNLKLEADKTYQSSEQQKETDATIKSNNQNKQTLIDLNKQKRARMDTVATLIEELQNKQTIN